MTPKLTKRRRAAKKQRPQRRGPGRPKSLRSSKPSAAERSKLGYKELRKKVLMSFEIDYVWQILTEAGGNLSLASRMARVDRKHLWRLLQRTGIRASWFIK
jgi:DNA-binding NtrC family response regulator